MRFYSKKHVRAVGLAEPVVSMVGYGLRVSWKVPDQSFPEGGFIPSHWECVLHGMEDETVNVYSTIDRARAGLNALRVELGLLPNISIVEIRLRRLTADEMEDEMVERAQAQEMAWYE